MATWIRLSEIAEKNLINKCIEHAKLVLETVKYMDLMIKSLSLNDRESVMKYYSIVDELEKRADIVKREIIEVLSRSVIHPIDRDYIVRLILSIDDIAAYAKAVARRLRLVLNLGFDIPAEIMEFMKRISHKIVEASSLVVKALEELIEKPMDALKYTHNIEDLEDEVDELRINALEILFKYCKAEFGPQCLLSKELIDNLESTSDKCEDTGDIIRAIAVSLGR